jgi:hypothetical protein
VWDGLSGLRGVARRDCTSTYTIAVACGVLDGMWTLDGNSVKKDEEDEEDEEDKEDEEDEEDEVKRTECRTG